MKRLKLWASLAALVLVIAACGGDAETTTTADGAATTTSAAATTTAPTDETTTTAETGGELSGTIDISGSSTVEPITARVAEAFAAANPGVGPTVEGPGTGDGFARFCAGETDISDASRPIKEEEAATCAAAGIEFVELHVATDGITVITSPDNVDVSCLTYPDLYSLVGPESEGFANWNDADALATELGGTGGFPAAPLVITAPGEE